ncbi:hypothetical protein [Sphingobacterium bambusae]|uniref:DUF4468 domain-containing protein n=1 Tax=Sphingobacterium bambusae TaxID=662858 RepID=A0ABW6BMI5_9SPHI|nr:hypothetical protein [Sphingobacterium bambusae]WPL47895.1 hypothetical protein SCB77_18255 [Sphingobacterium bambusae]
MPRPLFLTFLLCFVSFVAKSQFALTKDGFVDANNTKDSSIVRHYPKMNAAELYEHTLWYFPKSKFKVLEKDENRMLRLKFRSRVDLGWYEYNIFETYTAILNGYEIVMHFEEGQINYAISNAYWDAFAVNYVFRVRTRGKHSFPSRVHYIWNIDGKINKKWEMLIHPTEAEINKVITDFHEFTIK